ncbi:hypothetical protein CRG98_045709 [Punica granatum]|uniref:Uncharacterized protein n=1 Tax=Punica granatum TaxID=22663 RepID=A0A2I0HQA0_PUNGR|nr:hypothetical protein CRG98_045709 [Punica granatum]
MEAENSVLQAQAAEFTHRLKVLSVSVFNSEIYFPNDGDHIGGLSDLVNNERLLLSATRLQQSHSARS